jgi:hypothetical protein
MKQNYLTKSKFLVALFFLVIKLSGQQTYTFTNCGATGSVGPTQAQVNSTYSNTNLSGLVTTTTNGIQTWTVPYTGNFRIEARGAQGGTSGSGGGLGATMIGDFTLTVGEVIQILVGQVGDNGGTGPGGGGGGSFVVRTPYTTTSSILVIAGGGSGAGSYSFTPGVNTTTGVTGGVAGGTNGSGGLGGTRGAGGGGFLTDGAPCSVNTIYASPGQAFVNGGEGGPVTNNTTCNFTANGGFGGGSSHGGNCINNGGAGGGFSGGGGSSNTTSGGGGSFNAGTNQTNTSGANTGDGRVIITELCNIKIFASGTNSTNPSICSGQSLTLTTTAVSNYTWSTGNTTTTSIVVSPTSSQTYSIIGTSSLACVAATSISVTVSPGLPVLTITNTPNTICLGKTATLTAGGALTYTWSGGSVPVTNGQSFLPTATTTYTVAGQNGCGISTSTTAITIAPLVVTASANPTLVCAGSPATLTAVSSVNGYTWTPSNSVINPAVVGPSVNTIYTVAASDGTCFGTATVAVNTKPNPTITIAASSSVVCEGAVVTMTASGGSTYNWTPGNLTTAAISDNPIAPILYQVVGTSTNGCTSQASQIVLTNTAPIVMVSSNKTIVCSGDPAILTASGANAYNWTNGPSTAVNQVNPTAPSVYTVTGTGSNSCTATKTIAVNVLAANVSASSSTSSICNGGTTTLTASGANTYVWVGTPSFLGVAFVSPTVTTNYSVTANTTIVGLSCPSSTNITITVFNNPTVSILATKTVVCKSDPAITLTGTGAVTYTWSTNATSLTISVKPQVTTTYTVSGTDANGCKNTAAKQIVVNTCNSVGELSGAEKGLSVYPNPSNGVFEVKSETDLDLSIVNELGQVIRTIKLSAQNNHTVQVDDLTNGVYFIVGQNNDLKINQKIIIAK